MSIMSLWLAKMHQTATRTEAKPFLSDVFPRGACRKSESAGNGALPSGEKNFSVHRTYMNFLRPRQRAPETALYDLRELLPQNAPDTTLPDDDVYDTDTCRKAESAGNGVLPSGEKNFSVHKTYMNFSRPRKRAPEAALYDLRELLPQNVPDTTLPDDDVYTYSTRRGRGQVDGTLSGRSMVEMLGVLAIIGVLSVGAISGYQKAMFKYKLNQQSQQISTLINSLMLEHEKLDRDYNLLGPINFTPAIIKLGIVPTDMYHESNTEHLFDVFNNTIHLWDGVDVNNYFRLMVNLEPYSVDQCLNLFTIAKEYRADLWEVLFWRQVSEDSSLERTNQVWGDKYCSGTQNCLAHLTLNDMEKLCATCSGTKTCSFNYLWYPR